MKDFLNRERLEFESGMLDVETDRFKARDCEFRIILPLSQQQTTLETIV